MKRKKRDPYCRSADTADAFPDLASSCNKVLSWTDWVFTFERTINCSRISRSCYLVQRNFGKKLFEFINFSCHAEGHQLKIFWLREMQRKAIPPAPTETTHCCQNPSRSWLQAGKNLRCCHPLPPAGLELGSHPRASLGQVCQSDINHQVNAKRVVTLKPQVSVVLIKLKVVYSPVVQK